MSNTIDMKLMRYINLFSKISRVNTTNCFVYNNVIIFAVPRDKVSQAIGKRGANMKKVGEAFQKKVKVIPMPKGREEMKNFIENIVSPVGFNKIEIKDNNVTISAGKLNKAALIGRGRAREKELGEILKRVFGVATVRVG